MSDPLPVFNRLKASVERESWPDVETRLERLHSLKTSIVRHRDEIRQAVWDDFKKPPIEADLTETMPVLLELRTAVKHLKTWAAPRRVRGAFPLWGLSSWTQYRPKGTVLVVSPWNYPVNLSLGPLVSALAAGNRVVIKPSERTPHSSELIARIVGSAIDEDIAVVVEGGADLGSRLLELPFDHFFFTGGARVGRLVMRAAADHLSTATLELGGKSPAIVDGTTDIPLCVEKIVRGKYLNGGQTCIAPDYALIRDQQFDQFLSATIIEADRFAGTAPMALPVDDTHADHLAGLLEDAENHGAVAHRTGDGSGLTVVTNVPLTCRLMNEEIFGPILPVLRYRSEQELFGMLEQNPTPLTTYVFSRSEAFVENLTQRLQTGSLCINDTLLHFVHPRIPFGGIGNSGSGRGHGEAGFQAFSNVLPTVRQNLRRGILPLLYPRLGRMQDSMRSTLFWILSR